MLRKSSPPIEPRRFDAPMTATERGWKNGSSEARTATWSRSATCSRYVSVGRDREPDLELAALAGARDREARRRGRRGASRSFSCSTSATNSSIPACAARAASCSSRRVPIPRRWTSSPTAKATSATRGSRSRTQFASGDDAAVERPEQRAALLPVRLEQRARRASARARGSRGSGGSGCARTELARRTRAARRRPPRRALCSRSVDPSRRMTSVASTARCRGDAHAAAACSARRPARPDDEHRARRRMDEPGRDAAGEEPPRGAPAVRADDDQLRVVLARDPADLLDGEPVGRDRRAVRRLPPRRPPPPRPGAPSRDGARPR